MPTIYNVLTQVLLHMACHINEIHNIHIFYCYLFRSPVSIHVHMRDTAVAWVVWVSDWVTTNWRWKTVWKCVVCRTLEEEKSEHSLPSAHIFSSTSSTTDINDACCNYTKSRLSSYASRFTTRCESEIIPFSHEECHDDFSIYLLNLVTGCQISRDTPTDCSRYIVRETLVYRMRTFAVSNSITTQAWMIFRN
jgi:hypothetical protein